MSEKIGSDHNEYYKAETGQILTAEERRSIEVLADIRRRQSAFKQGLLNLEAPEYEDMKKRHNDELIFVMEVVGRENLPASKPTESYEALTAEGKKIESDVPNLAALKFARAAEIKELSSEDPFEALQLAKSASLKSAELPRFTPASFLSDAMILGIEQRAMKKIKLPGVEKVAHSSPNRALLEEYALVVSRKDRERFIASLPSEEQQRASAIMDKVLAPILKESIVATEAEREEQKALKERASRALKGALHLPEKSSKEIVKLLVGTLMEIEDEESKRMLFGFTKEAVAGKTSKEKISYAARMIRELAVADIAKGGNAAMKFLARSEIPPRLFRYFSELLMKEKYITGRAEKYIRDVRNVPWVRKLIAEYPNQFNTVIDTVSEIKNYNPADHSDEIFNALKDLDSLTPIIFDRYRLLNPTGRKELALKIRELKPKFFQNVPIKDILRHEDRKILAEMVYLAYKPINMSFEKVRALIDRLEDQTDDLRDLRFPQEGYEFSLEQSSRVILKTGEKIDFTRANSFRELFRYTYPEQEEDLKHISSLLSRLAKAGVNATEEEISRLMSVMRRDEFVQNFLKRYEHLSDENIYNYFAEAKEIFGIYFKDNFRERLANFLGANPTIEGQLAKILTNPTKQEQLKKQLGQSAEEIPWGQMNERKEMTRLLVRILDSKILRPVRGEINKNLSKFQREGGEKTTAGQKRLRAYISKNVGSFFAKASAGICTAEDIPLFERNDHFHINIVEDNQYVRANIQAYIIKDGQQRSLVLRGFNPNTDFVDKVDVRAFSEQVLEIAKRFAHDNNLAEVYITEQGGWHALSNREKVASYLTKKYHQVDRQKPYSLHVTSGHTISFIYKV